MRACPKAFHWSKASAATSPDASPSPKRMAIRSSFPISRREILSPVSRASSSARNLRLAGSRGFPVRLAHVSPIRQEPRGLSQRSVPASFWRVSALIAREPKSGKKFFEGVPVSTGLFPLCVNRRAADGHRGVRDTRAVRLLRHQEPRTPAWLAPTTQAVDLSALICSDINRSIIADIKLKRSK